MRIVFMGTPEFAVPSLEKLIESQHELVAVISQPDRPAGRGHQLNPTPTKKKAEQEGIPVYQPEKIRTPEFLDILRSYEPDVIAVVAYGRILPDTILSLPRFGCINVHASLLPKYRGAAPIQWALINCDRKTGVTTMRVDSGQDTGDIIRQKEVDILDDDDAVSLSGVLSVLGAACLIETLDEIERTGRVDATPQDDSQATEAPKITKEDGHIDWKRTPDEIICRMMGLKPWPGAYSVTKEGNYKFLKAESFYPEESLTFLEKDQKPGEVIDLIKDRGPVVRTVNDCICITTLQPPNRKPMSGVDAINGGYVKLGMVFR